MKAVLGMFALFSFILTPVRASPSPPRPSATLKCRARQGSFLSHSTVPEKKCGNCRRRFQNVCSAYYLNNSGSIRIAILPIVTSRSSDSTTITPSVPSDPGVPLP